MSNLKPRDKVPVWKCPHAYERMQACAAMLNLHEFLTDGERKKVDRRIAAWGAKHEPQGNDLE